MPSSFVSAAAAATELGPAPITPEWILSGTPEARNKMLAISADRTAFVMVWECSPGLFNWHYEDDETLVIISGEVFITDKNGQERRMGPGDMGFFPAGSSCTWRITDQVRKVAVVCVPVPSLLALGLRAWIRLLRIARIKACSPLAMPLLCILAGA
jgi:hypothetical protein